MSRAKTHDCLVIGGGPAGLVAGTYLARYRRDVALVDAGDSRAAKIPVSRNVPGFPDGVSGVRLLERLRDQAQNAGIVVDKGCVESLARDGKGDDAPFVARVGRRVVRARRVLLATGSVDHAPLPGLTRQATLRGLVRWCPICDGCEALDEKVVLIGEREHGVPHALFLRTWTRELTLVIPPGKPLPAKARRQLHDAGVPLLRRTPARVRLFDGEGELVFTDGSRLRFQHLYPMTGGHARSELGVALGARTDAQRALVCREGRCTAVPGLYAAGDVVASLRQISVATAEGALAATAIHNSLPRNYR